MNSIIKKVLSSKGFFMIFGALSLLGATTAMLQGRAIEIELQFIQAVLCAIGYEVCDRFPTQEEKGESSDG